MSMPVVIVMIQRQTCHNAVAGVGAPLVGAPLFNERGGKYNVGSKNYVSVGEYRNRNQLSDDAVGG